MEECDLSSLCCAVASCTLCNIATDCIGSDGSIPRRLSIHYIYNEKMWMTFNLNEPALTYACGALKSTNNLLCSI